jgi:hypothetical protein
VLNATGKLGTEFASATKRCEWRNFLRGVGFVINQVTVSDLVVVVMDAALEASHDKTLASEITSRVLVDILEKLSPGTALEFIDAFKDRVLH